MCIHRCVACMYTHVNRRKHMHRMYVYTYTADHTWGHIFESCFKAQSSKLKRLFLLKRGKRDVRALSFELSKMSPQVGLAVPASHVCIHTAQEWSHRTVAEHACSKCKYYVSQKQNGFNNKIHWYSILLTFIFKFAARL